LDSDLTPYLKKHKTSIETYRSAVSSYKNADTKEQKREMLELVEKFKTNLGADILHNHPLSKRVESLKSEVKVLELPQSLFEESKGEKRERLEKRKKRIEVLEKAQVKLDALQSDVVFAKSFEWRLEFPEALKDSGEFEGFDIVIGNPPYISAIGLKKILNEHQYDYLKNKFSVAKGAVDLYVYFFELASLITKKESSLCYICPNRYLSANYAVALRNHLLDHYEFVQLDDYSKVDVFEEAQTYPVVTLLRKPKPESYELKVHAYADGNQTSERSFASKILGIGEERLLGFVLSDKYDITRKVMSQSENLLTAGEINATSTAAEADAFSSHIVEGTGNLKLINTGTIDRYKTNWGVSELIDKGRRFKRPYLPDKVDVLGKNRAELYGSPKILFAKIALRTEAFFDERGEFASINTNCLHSFSKDYDPLYVLAWVNSNLFQYVYECLFDGLRMAGGFLPYSAPYLSTTFIHRSTAAKQKEIARLARKMIDSKSSGEISREIDALFYKLLDLTAAEVAAVDKAIGSSSQ